MSATFVNKQKYRIWGKGNQQAYFEEPMQPKRFTVWGWFRSRCIIGPFSLKMIKLLSYRFMNKFLLTKTEEKNIDKIFNIQKKLFGRPFRCWYNSVANFFNRTYFKERTFVFSVRLTRFYSWGKVLEEYEFCKR